jgi:hypothetical protein
LTVKVVDREQHRSCPPGARDASTDAPAPPRLHDERLLSAADIFSPRLRARMSDGPPGGN